MFRKLNYAEPSVLRGIVTAVLALAASLGFVASDEINGFAEGLIPVVAFLLPLVQAVWTRAGVFSPKTFHRTVGKHAAGLSNGPQV